MPTPIPSAKYALIGGSGTWGARFPEDIQLEDVELVEVYRDGFETPYGQSCPFKLLRIGGQPVWRVAMHGMFMDNGGPLIAPWIAAKQVAHVLEQAGVQWALVEGSVGGIQNPDAPGQPLPPWSVVISTDYMMLFRPDDSQPYSSPVKRSVRLREPFCPILGQALYNAALAEPKFASVHKQGVYVCSPWGRFETVQEIQNFANLGAHVVGHTLGHEAPVMRRAGVRLASLNIVSNHAEGIENWSGDEKDAMGAFYDQCPHFVGPVMVKALRQIIEQGVEPPVEDGETSVLGRFPVPGA